MSPTRAAARERWAFTLIEIMLVVTILGVLASLAVPSLQTAADAARVARAAREIGVLQSEIAQRDSLPSSLADIGRGTLLDPWGRPYVYLKFGGKKGGGIGAARKDRFLVPLNSDYDLYSVGKDGASAAPLSAKQSQDDVIRANNGGFVGLASHY